MADPLLTTLCAICHISTPKYKCPRCNIQTCSLGCIKKHKAWSECSGERDATAYVAPSKLRTPAGVDHDYNFLHGIERSVERSERLLVGERGLVQQEELRPLTTQEVRWKTGRDGKKRKVVTTRVLREAKGRVFERFLAQRLKKLNVRILCAPMGMARQKENNTTLNRKSGRINWQVEWLMLQQDGPTEHVGTQNKRLLSKVMDDVPLYQAYYDLLQERGCEAVKTTVPRSAPRAKAHQSQSSSDSRWTADMDGLQDALTGMWLSPAQVDAEEDERRRRQYHFFLGSTSRRSDLPTKMASVESGDCLREILRNGQVLEYPTIYVLHSGATLPPGFVLGPKDSAAPAGQKVQGTKRKVGPSEGKGSSTRSAKKQRQQGAGGGETREEGEVGSDEEEGEQEEEASGAGTGTGKETGVALEAGEVMGEESFGEDEDGMDEDDETSSSGSDSE